MKIRLLSLIVFVGFVFTSCNNDDKVQWSPSVSLPQIYTSTGEELGISKVNDKNVLDVVNVGDTVIIESIGIGWYNNLLEYQISISNKDAVKLIWPEPAVLDEVFTDYTLADDQGKFTLNGTKKEFKLTFKFVALEEDVNQRLYFYLLSDADAEYSQAADYMFTPIIVSKD